MSHCKHLPRYIVAVEVAEKLEMERDNYRSALRRALEALTDARDCGCEISLEVAIEAARQSLHNVKEHAPALATPHVETGGEG
jgi:ribosomal protein S3